jgi:hypothetical protein
MGLLALRGCPACGRRFSFLCCLGAWLATTSTSRPRLASNLLKSYTMPRAETTKQPNLSSKACWRWPTTNRTKTIAWWQSRCSASFQTVSEKISASNSLGFKFCLWVRMSSYRYAASLCYNCLRSRKSYPASFFRPGSSPFLKGRARKNTGASAQPASKSSIKSLNTHPRKPKKAQC